MLTSPILSGQRMGGGVLTIVYASNQSTVNLKDDIETIYGAQASAVTVICTINSGVIIAGDTTATPAFSTGGFPSGSTVSIVNYGSIQGKGGTKGNGGPNGSNGSSGGDGRDAISLDDATTIDNTTTGQIFAGGGGGGGGGGGSVFCFPGGAGDGGDGGGGRGWSGAAGYGDSGTGSAGKGGKGGDWGSDGGQGKDNDCGSKQGGGRGNGGYAVRKNGKTLTWVAGYNSTQVKGTVA